LANRRESVPRSCTYQNEKVTNSGRGWKRVDGVDLLRGLAIFFVLINHVNIRLLLAKVPYTKGIPGQLVGLFVWNGQFGVQIFFAVSGFLITSTTLRRWGKLSQVSPRDFYLLRFARIAPLLLLLLAVLSGLDLAHFRDFVIPPNRGGLGRALLAAVTFHLNLLESRRGYLPGSWDILWSLSIEEMFYLFFPLLCRFTGRGRMLTGILLVFVALGPFGRTLFAQGLWKEYSYLGGMDAIAFGCLTAMVVSRTTFSRSLIRMLAGSGAAILIFILGFSRETYTRALDRTGLGMTILALGTCMIIAAAAQTDWKSPSALRPMLLLGQRSYEVYLTHMFVVFALFNLFVSRGKPMGAVPVLFIAVILIAGVLGEVVARFYSDPMNRLLRNRFGDGSDRLGSVTDNERTTRVRKHAAA
jgi:peptidoglycan/LPS O-acetylase OafA/YrhL